MSAQSQLQSVTIRIEIYIQYIPYRPNLSPSQVSITFGGTENRLLFGTAHYSIVIMRWASILGSLVKNRLLYESGYYSSIGDCSSRQGIFKKYLWTQFVPPWIYQRIGPVVGMFWWEGSIHNRQQTFRHCKKYELTPLYAEECYCGSPL